MVCPLQYLPLFIRARFPAHVGWALGAFKIPESLSVALSESMTGLAVNFFDSDGRQIAQPRAPPVGG
jgi:hypothetical protein